jgi:hypothetical protein
MSVAGAMECPHQVKQTSVEFVSLESRERAYWSTRPE